MTWVKGLALVLGSIWFFPVSCSSVLYVGIHAIAHLDAREVARGDRLHRGFSVVVELGDDGKAFRLVRLSDLPQFRAETGAYSLLMSKQSGRIDVNEYTHVSYRVLENKGSIQVIEVEDSDDDLTLWSRYSATPTDVTPLATRMLYVGYMFSALPYAFGSALLLCSIGKFLRRRLRIAGAASSTS